MVACIALLRCAPHAPILPLSSESCAAAISFCATNLPSPSAMFSIAVSVFSRLAELQPPAACLAAWAGTTANATAAIAITPSNFVMTLPSFSCSWARASDIAGVCDITFLRARQLDAMNSPRELRDVARHAEPHAKFLIFITRLQPMAHVRRVHRAGAAVGLTKRNELVRAWPPFVTSIRRRRVNRWPQWKGVRAGRRDELKFTFILH